MPIYNEERTLFEIVEKVQKVVLNLIDKEIIIVDDASRDKSNEIIERLMRKYKNIKYFKHDTNKGKGAAIRTGIQHISGDYVVIQDGDLEYNPNDFKKLLKPIFDGKAEVVYGSRIMGSIEGFKIPTHYYGNLFLSFLTRILYGQKITDMETCYKMMTKKLIKSLHLRSNHFDIEPEITAKIIKRGYKILEIPISYKARSFMEGKKINWKDGIIAIFTLVLYRFFD